ncbi:NAD(P)/FAD-dependent oxidoreductase [Bradyrhizobium sp. 197]|uniref:flavin-containing monooxygenase n=1 Tax=Bradyrhizobium sp. 197 TaxID=2782663 RepID=UPI001FFA40E2|nr:NAD(P)/FAD-dependent oxidoreductase [Bradyrhizobium sp. 197]MCK1479527.1 NAD(P)/FAD-dependent oxidoreductase [Bradyrhizobium sp. 197]
MTVQELKTLQAAGPQRGLSHGVALQHHIQRGADLPTLLMTTAHTTGDLSVLRNGWRPVDVLGVAQCKVSDEEKILIREECYRRLADHSKRGGQPPARPTYDLLRGIGEWFLGSSIEPLIPLLAEELIFDGYDLRQPQWNKEIIAPDRPFHVAIIGAGESGIIAAIRLKQAGIPFTIYEKNGDVGGTWLENHYPGCRVDINSFVYSYASAPRVWRDYFGLRNETLSYLQQVANDNGLYEHVKFGAEIQEAVWSDKEQVWNLTVNSAGKTETVSPNMIVFAVGQLNRPKLPEIPGIDSFKGESFHSAQWNHNLNLQGKRVGVIGTGASACQFIPQIASVAAKVTVFARTATWLLPTPNLHEPVEGSERWLFENLPGYAQWYRGSLLILQTPGILEHVVVDPNYAASEQAVSESNNFVRQELQQWLEAQIAERPDLREAIIPNSPVGSKRILRDNGTWARTLMRDNVDVIREKISEITVGGIGCADGNSHEFDVIVYGTGFQASKFLFPIKVRGANGCSLQDAWKNGARAYLGMTIPQFPNMFCMYGPNTNLVVHGASIVMFSELTAKYIVDAVRVMLEKDAGVMDVREEVFSGYDRRLDEANRARAWGYSKVNSWYKDANGRVGQNYPFTATEFYQRTNAVVAADYRFGPVSTAAGR